MTQDPDAEYFQSIEEHFVSRRGDPLFLSNADWLLIRRWRESGLPLRVVQRGITDAMDSHEHSWSQHKKVGSLRYCSNEVDASATRWRRALQGGHDEPALSGLLLGLEQSLRHATGLGARGRAAADEIASELEARAEEGSDPESLEPWLRPAWSAAADDAARLRVVVDQVASLTDTSAAAWHRRLVRS